MGGGSSKERSLRQSSSLNSSSTSSLSGYPPRSQQQQEPPSSTPTSLTTENNKILNRKYSRIANSYRSIQEVTEALARAGLDYSNLIVGIDFTKSYEQCLHHIGDGLNPYDQVISINGKTMAAFAEDNLIPCFGFGDGPTSFAPIIEAATTIVEQSGGQYHVLLIIASGPVTRGVDTEHGRLSPQEQKTVDAIVEASNFPLSIILVGVGDGPWDKMKEFHDNIPARAFDHFQFVNFTEIMSKNVIPSEKETEFARAALKEIPSQYKAAIEFNLLGCCKGNAPQRVALPPPSGPSSSTYDNKLCPICLTKAKNMAFGCGHQTCCECGPDIRKCPICRSPIQTRIKLYALCFYPTFSLFRY